jgi:hypothetical protein
MEVWMHYGYWIGITDAPYINTPRCTQIQYRHLRGMSNEEKAMHILSRIQREFEPIIRRRGYNVVLVGEYTDDRDAVHEFFGRAVGIEEKSNEDTQIEGYNCIGWINNSTSVLIGLRLRTLNNYMFQFYSYSEICEVMCHKLAHCVHGDHGDSFYKLMREIQREHAWLVQRMGNIPKPKNRTAIVRKRDPQKGRKLSNWMGPRRF